MRYGGQDGEPAVRRYENRGFGRRRFWPFRRRRSDADRPEAGRRSLPKIPQLTFSKRNPLIRPVEILRPATFPQRSHTTAKRGERVVEMITRTRRRNARPNAQARLATASLAGRFAAGGGRVHTGRAVGKVFMIIPWGMMLRGRRRGRRGRLNCNGES